MASKAYRICVAIFHQPANGSTEKIGKWVTQPDDGRGGEKIGKLHFVTFFGLDLEDRSNKIVTDYLLILKSMPFALAPQTPTTDLRQRHSAKERREEAVEAVIDLASAHSPEGITTQAIATRIGVTHGALFRHFPDKAAIWRTVFDWLGVQLGRVADAAIANGGTPLEVLERLFHAQVAFVASHPGVPRILFHELQRPAGSPLQGLARNIVGGYRERIKTLIHRAKEIGELPIDLDEDAAAVLFVGTVQGLVVQSTLFSGTLDMRAAAQRIFPLLLNGFLGAKS